MAFAAPSFAQHYRQPSQMSLDGTFTFATLPSAASYPGYTAYTSDQGPVYSNGSAWASMAGGGVPPTITANTVLGNGTASTAAPQQLAMPSCSTAGSALKWTTSTGFGCNSSIDAATLGGATFAVPGSIGSGTAAAGAFTTISATGVITSTLATGTAPFTVASSTVVGNLNASLLNGATFAAPGSIGSGTPGAGAFTTLTSSSGMALSQLATQATNTVVGNATSGTAVPTALAVGTCSTSASALNWTTNTGFGCNTSVNAATLGGATFASPGAIGGTVASAGSFTTVNASGLITPSTTVGIKGTAAADTAQAGSIGEDPTVNCSGSSTATITVTIATPAVVTWSSHPFSAAEVSSGIWTCAINFTNSGGALPTGIVAGTNYFIVGSTLSGDTFQIADTVAHALAGTNIVATSGSQSGTQTGWMGNLMTNGSNVVVNAMNITAGDYDCSGDATLSPVTSLTTTGWGTVINMSNVATFTHGQSTRYQVASLSVGTTVFDLALPIVRTNSSSTVTVALGTIVGFSGGTTNTSGVLRCRRMR